ncbi:PilZ domain-containing protein [bacterium]|nr:PilZ domain-containing protein [bacterium]
MAVNVRGLIRAYVPLRVDYKILSEPQIKDKTLSKNFCISGINIFVPHQLQMETLIELKVYLPSTSEAILVKGKIVWQDEVNYMGTSKRKYFATGIKFTEIDSIDKTKFTKCILTHLSDKTEKGNKEFVDKIESLNWNSGGF